jgi:hypothetical protein
MEHAGQEAGMLLSVVADRRRLVNRVASLQPARGQVLTSYRWGVGGEFHPHGVGHLYEVKT